MNVVGLGRAFQSILGAPVIRAVDMRIFALRYFTRCMACDFCSDQCCNYGVDVDRGNMDRLRALGPGFEAFVGSPPSEWFTGDLHDDVEFPSGAYGRTRTVYGKCVFADRQGRGCRIHAWCLDHGLDYHDYKPLVSTLFPVTFEQGVLVPSPEVVDGTLLCSGDGPALYDGVRGELGHYFGEAFVALLDGLRSSVRSEARRSAAVPARR
ncbi:MAG: hypothetical protein KGJ78_09770 [Alphaproteobacteria bacterium]|nr:hypothetical protein [Alphaproteobacteria bacterium]